MESSGSETVASTNPAMESSGSDDPSMVPSSPEKRTSRSTVGVVPAEIHPDLRPLQLLVGTWEGPGEGRYPTIGAFTYLERVTIEAAPKPFLIYGQRTTDARDGRPLHSESGFWRLTPTASVELVIAHPSGIVEVQEGPLVPTDEGLSIEFRSTAVARTSTSKEVTSVERTFRLTGDWLRYEVRMAAVGQPLQFHLEAQLVRTS